MTIDKAIEIITQLRRNYLYTFNQDPIDALGLGIEALKFYQDWKKGVYNPPTIKLPGETEE